MKKNTNAAKKPDPTRKNVQNARNNQRNAAPKASSPQPKAAPRKPMQKPVQKKKGSEGILKKSAKRPAVSAQKPDLNRPASPNMQNRPVSPNMQKRPASPNMQKRPDSPKTKNRPDPKGQLAAKAPQKPVSEQSRKAADNAARAKAAAAAKKRPYRGGNYSLYFILTAIVIVIVLIVLANTVLFKCGTIEVVGTARYTSEEIIECSGLKTGENLLHIDTKSAEQKIINAFAFIDKAEIKKSFPTKIVVEITEAENWFVISEGGKKSVISRGDRVLGEISSDGLVVVKGFEAENIEPGCYLKSKVETKSEMPGKIFETAEQVGLSGITEIDMTDRFSIKITVEDRIVLNIGPINQLESKLRVAEALIRKEIGEEENVSVLLTNPEKVAIETINPTKKPVQSTKPDKPEQSETPESTSSEQPENPESTSSEQSEPPESTSSEQSEDPESTPSEQPEDPENTSTEQPAQST